MNLDVAFYSPKLTIGCDSLTTGKDNHSMRRMKPSTLCQIDSAVLVFPLRIPAIFDLQVQKINLNMLHRAAYREEPIFLGLEAKEFGSITLPNS